jgi:MarR family transcriptional regulator, temperature-dependent positive regulator of motility
MSIPPILENPEHGDAATVDAVMGQGVDPMAYDPRTDSLGFALKLAQLRANDLLAQALAQYGVSPARMTALSLIATRPGISQALLAEELRITGPSVVKVIDALEAVGYVQRQPGTDRRSHALALTALGTQELRAIRTRLAGFERVITARLTDEEREQLRKILPKVGLPAG